MASALDPQGARSHRKPPEERERDRKVLPWKRGEHGRHLPCGAGGRRHRVFQVRPCRRADRDAHLRGVHEDRSLRTRASAEAAGRAHPLNRGKRRRTMTFNRRRFVQAAGAFSLLGNSFPLKAQTAPIRLGLMTVKTGPLASGGIDMERALVQYLRERSNTLAGRKVELLVGDSGGVPAQARTKVQELVERERIHVMIGPLATGEALAADDYIRQAQLLTLSVAAAEDTTQRKPNPWFTRGTATSSQCRHPLADYCYQALKYRRMAVIADDIPDGHEMCAGFMRVFEDLGGKIVQKMFPPLTVPDYGTYLAQLNPKIDGIFLGFAGSNGFRYLRQFNEYGLRGKVAPVGGMTALDEAVLRNMGDETPGIVTACWYSAEIENAINKRFVANFRRDPRHDPRL